MSLTEFKSDVVETSATSEIIYDYLRDFNNFGKLLPEQVSEWKANEKSCSFKISSIATFYMSLDFCKPYEKVTYSGNAGQSGTQIQFNLEVHLSSLEKGKTAAYLVVLSELNPFLKMMLQNPMKNFVNVLAQKLKQHFDSLKQE